MSKLVALARDSSRLRIWVGPEQNKAVDMFRCSERLCASCVGKATTGIFERAGAGCISVSVNSTSRMQAEARDGEG